MGGTSAFGGDAFVQFVSINRVEKKYKICSDLLIGNKLREDAVAYPMVQYALGKPKLANSPDKEDKNGRYYDDDTREVAARIVISELRWRKELAW